MVRSHVWLMVSIILLSAMAVAAGTALVTHRTGRCVALFMSQHQHAAAWEIIQNCQATRR